MGDGMERKLMHKRLSEIVEKLEKGGYVNAKDLAQSYQVSMETIRKDLHILEQMGLAQKEYGGASLSILSLEKRYDFRRQNIEKKIEIAKEIGDVLWYCATLANDIGFDLETIGQMNYDKLHSRQERGMLHGSGDNR